MMNVSDLKSTLEAPSAAAKETCSTVRSNDALAIDLNISKEIVVQHPGHAKKSWFNRSCFLRPTFSTKYPPRVSYASDERQLIQWVYSGVSGIRAWLRHKKTRATLLQTYVMKQVTHLITLFHMVLWHICSLRWYKEPRHCRLLLQTCATNHCKKLAP